MESQRNVLTIATGKKIYIYMAANLARSFKLWNKDNGIRFFIATDAPDSLPADVRQYVFVIKLRPGELGQGFEAKLWLDTLAPDGQTLFIDSDCLVYGDITNIFDRFKGRPVSVVGHYISDGEWFGDVAAVLKKFELSRMPKFNGGIYYLEKGKKATEVFGTARRLVSQYDKIGFVRLRNLPNDEVVMALAMAHHLQEALQDDGTILSDPFSCPGRYVTNVISGSNCLLNPPPPNLKHQSWYPFTKVSPLIIHFLGYHNADYQYLRDVYRLNKIAVGRLNLYAELYALFNIELKKRLVIYLKNAFRAPFHLIAGVRKVRPSERL